MKKFSKYFVLALFGFGLTSCLEDENVEEQKYGMINLETNKVIEIPTAASTFSLLIKNEQTKVNAVPIHLAAKEVAAQDIKVTLAVDPTTTTYPAGKYSFPEGLVATIPAGSRDGVLPVTINTQDLNPASPFKIGFKVVSVDQPGYVISGNFGSSVVTLSARNAYEGTYSVMAGTVQRYTNPTTPTSGDALNGSMAGNPDVKMATIDGTTVEISNLRWAGGTSGIAGIDNLRATVNPSTNQVTMFSLGNATLRNIAGATNSYDPASKTFTLNFEWNPTANKREVKGLVLKMK